MVAVAAATRPSATYRGSAACARDTKSLTAPCLDVTYVLVVFRGDTEWRDTVDVLGGDSQRLATGREQRDARAGAQQCLGHAGRRLDHMLTVAG